MTEKATLPDVQFKFRPLSRRPVWTGLALTMSQAATLTGASERQIQHWMDRGYIQPALRGTRKLNGESLDLIMLICQARQEGVPLRRAVSMARDYLTAERAGSADTGIEPALLEDLQGKLLDARQTLEAVEEMIQQAQTKEKAVRRR